MTEAADTESTTDTGEAFGAVARYRGELTAAALMAAADPGDDSSPPPRPPILGGAGVS